MELPTLITAKRMYTASKDSLTGAVTCICANLEMEALSTVPVPPTSVNSSSSTALFLARAHWKNRADMLPAITTKLTPMNTPACGVEINANMSALAGSSVGPSRAIKMTAITRMDVPTLAFLSYSASRRYCCSTRLLERPAATDSGKTTATGAWPQASTFEIVPAAVKARLNAKYTAFKLCHRSSSSGRCSPSSPLPLPSAPGAPKSKAGLLASAERAVLLLPGSASSRSLARSRSSRFSSARAARCAG
mmetsp:Transcript_18950/g.53651  ORF Transcript_18950/g.53651 Transcript_18950/m.53651 type:complete len:249 (-) Transcript_18950:72-818(-)